jgi:hypothetical protein
LPLSDKDSGNHDGHPEHAFLHPPLPPDGSIFKAGASMGHDHFAARIDSAVSPGFVGKEQQSPLLSRQVFSRRCTLL